MNISPLTSDLNWVINIIKGVVEGATHVQLSHQAYLLLVKCILHHYAAWEWDHTTTHKALLNSLSWQIVT